MKHEDYIRGWRDALTFVVGNAGAEAIIEQVKRLPPERHTNSGNGGGVPEYSQEVKDRAVQLRREGKSIKRIAQLTGVGYGTVRAWLYKEGLQDIGLKGGRP